MDDQDNIRILNMQGEINTLKQKVSDCKMESKNLKRRILRIEDCEDLRDQQMKVLKKFIDSYLLMNININGGEHGGKIGVLKVPEAKK